MKYDSSLKSGYYDLESLVFAKFSVRNKFVDLVNFLNERGYTILFNYDENRDVFFNIKK